MEQNTPTKIRIISPSQEEIDNFPTPLNDGEKQVLNLFCKCLPLEWEIYVQPPLNGLRPDFVLLNPNVGIAVFEVKDWNRNTKYWHDPDSNRLLMENPTGRTIVPKDQPIDKVNQYRSEIKNLYCPSMYGKKRFKLITAGLIFPQWSDEKILKVFDDNVRKQKNFKKCYKNNPISGFDSLKDKNIKKIFPNFQPSPDEQMNETIAEEMRSWLTNSEFDLEQGRFPRLTSQQSELVENPKKVPYRRIKGPAGSGKSIVLAARAAKLQSQQNKKVLVLSYNITLLNYLRDQAVTYDRGAREVVFLHYHSWAKRICSVFGRKDKWISLFPENKSPEEALNKDVPELIDKIINEWRSENPKTFSEQCYDAILVDEGQDFNLQWWGNLRQILNDDGEMMLVSDPTQDLYGTAAAWTDEAMTGAGFSGRWSELKNCYRMPKDLHKLTNEFAERFLPNNKEKVLANSQNDLVPEKVDLKWLQVKPEDTINYMVEEILALPKTSTKLGFEELSYADIVFLTLNKETGFEITEKLKERGFNISSVFADNTDENRREKLHFYKGSGRMKGSTIHSYKGLNSRALVVNIPVAKTPEDLNAIYVALTRLKGMSEGSFITVVCNDKKFEDYGNLWKGRALYRQIYPIEKISNNQTGITYEYLFAECLEGATVIDVTDPYLKTPYQFANLQEFLKTCRNAQNSERVLKFNLETGIWSDKDRLNEEKQNWHLDNVIRFAKELNIEFSWQRSRVHDRHIKTDHGWEITLGRGLDMFKDPRNNYQARKDYSLRQCRDFKVTYNLIKN